MPDTVAAPNAGRFGERLLRFYLGLEDPDDLIGDLQQAFHFRRM
jgi:cystathionine beta-lyase/cystathionine gamma-synthase